MTRIRAPLEPTEEHIHFQVVTCGGGAGNGLLPQIHVFVPQHLQLPPQSRNRGFVRIHLAYRNKYDSTLRSTLYIIDQVVRTAYVSIVRVKVSCGPPKCTCLNPNNYTEIEAEA